MECPTTLTIVYKKIYGAFDFIVELVWPIDIKSRDRRHTFNRIESKRTLQDRLGINRFGSQFCANGPTPISKPMQGDSAERPYTTAPRSSDARAASVLKASTKQNCFPRISLLSLRECGLYVRPHAPCKAD